MNAILVLFKHALGIFQILFSDASIQWFVKLWNEMIIEQVIVVDDGCSNGTKTVAFEFVKRYKVYNVIVSKFYIYLIWIHV